ncbi:hypothetical protein VB715_05620 [Crocosphaera sp. UHCC 0190]|uniref:hypothetical protein n=1 Tax=Crocosphaera sp. UHCC 0190 TaxID=3110246 RepID=UPI002B21F660|nr:hypothetical protein [Crocosphaera sp. UHCC 0190]MEA5509239.1 hypothetical protein [Crocosphaera sp. UHCC 0190]
MSQFPHDDRELISFLQRYRPLPPPPKATLEKQLFSRIVRESQSCQKTQLRWLIPSAMLATLLGIWGGYNLLQPSPYQQFMKGSTELEAAEIEDFMVNSWQQTISITEESSPQVIYSQWLSLGNLETQYLVSQP